MKFIPISGQLSHLLKYNRIIDKNLNQLFQEILLDLNEDKSRTISFMKFASFSKKLKKWK